MEDEATESNGVVTGGDGSSGANNISMQALAPTGAKD